MLKRLVWFRNDLRLHDNETLASALTDGGGSVNFVYIQHEKIGRQRNKFLAECLLDLGNSLTARGTNLLCLKGDPLFLLPAICRQLGIRQFFYSRLTAFDEHQVEAKLEETLRQEGITVRSFQTHTLIDDEDVQFDPYQHMSFSKRRTLVEKSWPVREPLDVTARFPPSIELDTQTRKEIGLDEWDFRTFLNDSSEERGFKFCGGETAAISRVDSYFRVGDHLRSYKETRNGLIELNDSAKLSPALSAGCLSARYLYREVRRYEIERVKNDSTLWFLYELLWRDHFHFLAKNRGARLFTEVGSAPVEGMSVLSDNEFFRKWCDGRTESLFINAAMNELRITGWLSNRMRQNAASYLIHDLQVDWRRGARWFEEHLIDYDPCSNWGNWAYIAGADVDRKPHVFDVEQQARHYDVDGRYTKLWQKS